MSEPIVIRLGPFEVLEPIGAGGMGQVWRARHTQLGVDVAIKLLPGDSTVKRREAFLREVQTIATLDHPHIVRVYDFGLTSASTRRATSGEIAAGTPWLAMELARGGCLDPGSITRFDQVAAVLDSVLAALGHAHSYGVIHRDIKPANVLVDGPTGGLGDDVVASLSDFGIAHHLDAVGEHEDGDPWLMIGTPLFMAPEQFKSDWRDYGPWTDLYAVGCLGWLLCTGQPPFVGESVHELAIKHRTSEPPRLVARFPVPPELGDWLRTALAKSPSRRFRHAADARFALEMMSSPDPFPSAQTVRRELDGHEVERDTPKGLRGWADVKSRVLANEPTIPTGGSDANTVADTLPELPTNSLDPLASEPPMRLEAIGAEARPPLPSSWRRCVETGDSSGPAGLGIGLYGLRQVPFTDRDEARDQIWQAMTEVFETRQTRAIIIRGPSGSGKSRLAEWIARLLAEVGAASLWRATHSPIAATRDGLERMVAEVLVTDGLSRPIAWRRTRDFLVERGATLDDAEELGSALLAITHPGGETNPRHSDDAQIPRVTFASRRDRYRVIGEFAAAASRRRPVVIWLDDVQWGHDALGLASSLLARDLPVLVLLTVRDEGLADRRLEAELVEHISLQQRTSTVGLGALEPDDQQSMIRRWLKLAPEVARQVATVAAGTPLFAIQLVGDWIERGLLEAREGELVLIGEAPDLSGSTADLWTQRIARLAEVFPGDVQLPLEVAAALGQQVDHDEWRQAVTAAGGQISDGLVAELVSRGLARRSESGLDGPGHWALSHGTLREVLVRQSRASGRWPELHRVCAEILLTRYGLTGETAWRIAEHYLEAGQPEQALEPIHRAAVHERHLCSYPRADQLLQLYDDTVAAIPLSPSDPRRYEAWRTRAGVATDRLRTNEAEAWGQRLLDAATAIGDRRLTSLAQKQLAHVDLVRGRTEESGRRYAETLVMDRELGLSELIIKSLRGLATVAIHHGRLEEGRQHVTEALDLAKRIEDGPMQGHCLKQLGQIARSQGDLEDARGFMEAAKKLFARHGILTSRILALHDIADIDRMTGNLDKAEIGYREALRFWETVGNSDAHVARLNLVQLTLARGHFDEARAQAVAVHEDLSALGWPELLTYAKLILAVCAAGRDDVEGWSDYFGEAERQLVELGVADMDLARLARQAGEAWLRHGRPSLARQGFTLAAEQYKRLGHDDSVADMEARCR